MRYQHQPRRASILLLVLIIVPVLALAAYSFTHWMRAEATGSVAHLRATQSLWLAHSGVEYTRALLSDPANLVPGALNLFDNDSNQFAKIVVAQDFRSAQGFFSIVSPSRTSNTQEIRYGLVNESAKIPLHLPAVILRGSTDDQRLRLMNLPNMTEDVADAILDWIDPDNETRAAGCEADYYLSLPTPYSPRNAPPRTMGELLLIRGVTPWLLYGEDANLDGVLNPNENDGDRSWPPDNADGTLDRGWFPFLTIYSAAYNLNPNGESKININGNLDENKETLVGMFGQEWYDFVTAYKSVNAGKPFRAVSSLIDAKVEVPNQGPGGNGNPIGGGGSGKGQGKKEIKSPWTSQNVQQYLDNALQYLCVSDSKTPESTPGLIDITGAPFEVIAAIPGLSLEMAQTVAGATKERQAGDLSPAWLLTEGLVTLKVFQRIEPLITTQGRVYRFDSVGFFSEPGPVARVEAVVDATKSPPVVIYRRELAAVSAGYPHQMLIGPGTSAQQQTTLE